jgi:hypothetical protein
MSPSSFISPSENLASHRAEALLERLPIALAHGLAEIEPDKEPLKVSQPINLILIVRLISSTESRH